MRTMRLVAIFAALALIAVGCGGSSGGSSSATPGDGAVTPTADPGGGDGGGDGSAGEPTDGDGAGSDDGSGGHIITGNGKAHYELSGDVTRSADLAFVLITSVFDEAAGQAYLTYTNGAGDEVLIIALDRDGGSAVQYGNPEIAISPTPLGCTFQIDRLDAANASGSFDCRNQLAVKGEQVATASIKGTFEAHK